MILWWAVWLWPVPGIITVIAWQHYPGSLSCQSIIRYQCPDSIILGKINNTMDISASTKKLHCISWYVYSQLLHLDLDRILHIFRLSTVQYICWNIYQFTKSDYASLKNIWHYLNIFWFIIPFLSAPFTENFSCRKLKTYWFCIIFNISSIQDIIKLSFEEYVTWTGCYFFTKSHWD